MTTTPFPSTPGQRCGSFLENFPVVELDFYSRAARWRRRSTVFLSVCLAVISSAAQAQIQPVGPSPSLLDAAQNFAPATGQLRSLPPIQAIPIDDSQLPTNPEARVMSPPLYCDSQTLKGSATIRALRFWSDQLGVAVGDHGSIRLTHDGGKSWNAVESGLSCRFNDVIWVDRNRIVVVGGGYDAVTRISRGAVLVSNDAGVSWHRSVDNDLPMLWSLQYSGTDDLSSDDQPRTRIRAPRISVYGDRDPISGDVMFQSRDGGRSWQSISEPSFETALDVSNQPNASQGLSRISYPGDSRIIDATAAVRWSEKVAANFTVRCSCTLSDGTMICAGDHGNIFRSTDNGTTWVSTNGAAATCGVLVIAAGPDTIPWSLLGRESLENRIRTQLIVGDRARSFEGTWEQAAMHLGIAAADPYDSTDDMQSIDELRHWIDVHHPPIVAIDAAMGSDLKAAVLQHAVARGCERVVEYSRGTRGEMLMHDSALLPDCGAIAGDFNDDSLLIAADATFTSTGSDAAPWIAINTRYSGTFLNAAGDGLSSGVRLTSNHRLPNRESKSSRRRLQVVQGRLKQNTTIVQWFHSFGAIGQSVEPDKFNNALRGMLDQTSRVDQTRVAWSIANRSIGRGHQLLVWKEIERRFPESTAALLAGLHLRAREASKEWREHPPAAIAIRSADQPHSFSPAMDSPAMDSLPAVSQELLPSAAGHVTAVSPFQSFDTTPAPQPSPVVQVSAEMPMKGLRGFRPISSAGSATSTVRGVDLSWQMHPVRLIVEDAIARNQLQEPDINNEASAGDADVIKQPTHSADVRRIADRQSPWSGLLKPTSSQCTTAFRAVMPPRLDGRLDDPCWHHTGSHPAMTRGDESVGLRLAWDDRFVYLAVQSDASHWHAPGVSSDVGRRDADLNESDRVMIGFDIDGDLLTAMNICFTSDGRTHDDLDGFDHWDPTWYVASQLDSEQQLTTEIAIERTSLATSLAAGDSWFIESQSLTADQPRRFVMMPDPRTRIRVDFR